MSASFPPLKLKGQLRPSQREVIEIARRKLAAGQKRLHIVAPPGSGKTVLGLYLWAECVRVPTLVLSPNSAIQAQWAAKTDLFDTSSAVAPLVSTNPRQPALLTSITYQSVTLPRRGDADLDDAARELWRTALIDKGQAQDPPEADVWIDDLARHNPNYYQQRLAAYRKQARDQAALAGEALQALHPTSLTALERLRDFGLGLVIFDECHHLMEHWGRVLAAAHDLLGEPMIVGLTATPPDRDGKHPDDVRRYDEFFGPVDFEVPVPAVVKDGFLAPYQDLAYFVRPSPEELAFVGKADRQLRELVAELATAPKELAPTSATAASVASVGAPATPARATTAPSGALTTTTTTPTTSTGTSRSDSPAADPPEGMGASVPVLSVPVPSVPVPSVPLTTWLAETLATRQLPTGPVKDWSAFERRDPDFVLAARLFLVRHQQRLPDSVPPPALNVPLENVPEMNVLVPALDRYVRHFLRRSTHASDRDLADQTIQRLRLLGVQITETGCQACASPVGRVLAYSRSKVAAIVPILTAEKKALGERMRAIVVADFEKSSATSAEIRHLLDDEAGGAVAAFKMLLADPITDDLNPILVTGSSVLVDDDLAEPLEDAARQWLKEAGYQVELVYTEADGFHILNGQGSDWCPRVYVEMITELFQRGLTRCLVGTRGLLGEGWDANKINVLIDLTTVTTSMTVNQLRGRSIRLDPHDPRKLADNWDIVCLAPEFTKGLDDYKRFIAKHETLFGVTEDGAVEKGAGHVHAALASLQPEGLEDSIESLNAEMLARVARRDEMRQRWKIGEPYRGEPKRTIETRPVSKRERGGFPPFAGRKQPWSEHGLALAIGEAILGALHEAGLLASRGRVAAHDRGGGYVRVFLDAASPAEDELFTTSLHEALAPLERPRYVVPRDIIRREDTWLSKTVSPWLPAAAAALVDRLLRKEKRERVMWHAVPAALAKNKELVAVYQKHWNRLVSPGEATYAQRGEGEQVVDHARRSGLSPSEPVHDKEVFL